MKPEIKIDLNKAIANTRFMQDLNTVLYGAELVLKRVDATDSQIADIIDEIVKSAFAAIEFDFDSIKHLLRNETRLFRLESYEPAAIAGSPRYPEMPSPYNIADSNADFDFFEAELDKHPDQAHMYRMSDKAYDSRMDEDEDLESLDR